MLQCLCKAMQIASACCGATCLPAVPGACSYCCDAACLLACCPAHAAALQPRAAASMLRAAGPRDRTAGPRDRTASSLHTAAPRSAVAAVHRASSPHRPVPLRRSRASSSRPRDGAAQLHSRGELGIRDWKIGERKI